jgi:hypothetical protein
MASSAANVPTTSMSDVSGNAPGRQTYSDVLKSVPLAKIQICTTASAAAPEPTASGLCAARGMESQVSKGGLSKNQPVGGGEEVGTGKEAEVPPSPTATATEGVETEGETREPVVVIAFSNSLAITTEALVSVVNTDGYCIVSKTELLNHFLPEGWTGTVVLQLERSDGSYVRMSPGLDTDGTNYLWSLGSGEYKMEVAQPGVPKARTRRAGSSRGPPRMPCSSGPTSVARSVRTGYMSAATSFASGFGGRTNSSKIATPTTTTTCLNKGGGKESTQKGVSLTVEKPGIQIGSSSERKSKPIDWARGWSTKAQESKEGEVNSTEGKEEGGEKVASGRHLRTRR